MSPNDQDKEIVERLIAETNLSARMDALIGEICDKLREYGVASPHKAFNDLVDLFREYFMLEYERNGHGRSRRGRGGRRGGGRAQLLGARRRLPIQAGSAGTLTGAGRASGGRQIPSIHHHTVLPLASRSSHRLAAGRVGSAQTARCPTPRPM